MVDTDQLKGDMLQKSMRNTDTSVQQPDAERWLVKQSHSMSQQLPITRQGQATCSLLGSCLYID